MIYQLNGKPDAALTEKCQVHLETSDEQIVVDPDELRKKVGNYDHLMKGVYGVKPEVFFNTIPIPISHFTAFFDNNAPDLAGLRIYFAKRSPDPAIDDHELIFVPCREVKDQNGQVEFYEDMIPEKGESSDSYIVSIECRKPPGCGQGAKLLP